MTRRRKTMKMQCVVASCLFLLCLTYTHAECPSLCSCSESYRTVDCSWRGFRHLPAGLQRNIQSLNLTHNRLSDLDHQLSSFTHLRVLDISYNRLLHFPASLPRALWEINVSGNRLRVLNKDDTAYQWNLRVLDLSVNKLERVVFINNTLPNLKALNLSHNKFWTVPTNMPQNLEMVDLSHNTLVQILPGSLSRLLKLTQFYLHANRFTSIGEEALEDLPGLKLITLGDNPWACEETANISHLLLWTKHTSARVLGCPCHTWHTCGEAHLSPYVFRIEEPYVQPVTTHLGSGTSLISTRDQTGSMSTKGQESFKSGRVFSSNSELSHSTTEVPVSTRNDQTASMSTKGQESFKNGRVFSSTSEVSHSTTEVPVKPSIISTVSTTRRTTTLRTRSVKRPNQSISRNTSSGHRDGSLFTSVFCSLLLMAMKQGL